MNKKLQDSPENVILIKYEDGNGRKQEWNYHSVISQMNYLARTTRPDILFAVHQCAKYSIDTKQSHEGVVKRIELYLKNTKDKGLALHQMYQMVYNVMSIHTSLDHGIKKMQIKLDQFCQETDT